MAGNCLTVERIEGRSTTIVKAGGSDCDGQLAVYDDINGWQIDQYLGNAEFYNNYGHFDLNIDVPAGWIVGATGVLQNPQEVLTAKARERLGWSRRHRPRAPSSAGVFTCRWVAWLRLATTIVAVPTAMAVAPARMNLDNIQDLIQIGEPNPLMQAHGRQRIRPSLHCMFSIPVNPMWVTPIRCASANTLATASYFAKRFGCRWISGCVSPWAAACSR